MVDYNGEFDLAEDKYMAISLNYHGDIRSRDANASVQRLKREKLVTFVEWCPTGFKIGLNEWVPPSLAQYVLLFAV